MKSMNQIKSLARALSLAVLLALPAIALAQELIDAHTMSFEIEGTWGGTGREEKNLWGGTISGESSLGPVTGTWVEHGGDKRVGSGTWDYPHGSFTLDYVYRREGRTSVWSGTYVITGGTGRFEGATGDGVIVVIGGPGTGAIFFNGKLSW